MLTMAQETSAPYFVGKSPVTGVFKDFIGAADDDRLLFGRGPPVKRWSDSGIITTIGGLGHTLPYLISCLSTTELPSRRTIRLCM